MSIRYILFDLDGTLLPMDQDQFIQHYLGALSEHMIPHGFEPQQFIKTIWIGTAKMFQNNGFETNEQVFWCNFLNTYGLEARGYEPIFEKFYHTDFLKIQASCGFDPRASQTVKALKSMGFKIILATQPIFPAIATETRMEWAGLDRNDFELYTTYENSHFCKPNPAYYREILDKLGISADECLMVGNDATEDMIAQTIGMKVFLLTDCLINKNNLDLSGYPQGNFDSLLDYIQSM